MPTSTKNVIYVFRGNDKTLAMTIYQPDRETVYNLTGCTVTLYIKKRIQDDNDDAIITLSGALTGAASGQVEFYLLPTHTNSDEAKANLKDNKLYPFEVEVVTDDVPPKYYTALRSNFCIVSQYR